MAVIKPKGMQNKQAKLTDHLDKNKGDSGKLRVYNFKIDAAKYKDLQEFAEKRDVPTSSIVKLALYEYMANHAKEWKIE